jgi:hypothetical protein
MGLAKRGYEVVGSWSERDQTTANRRAKISLIPRVSFPIGDAQRLREYQELVNAFESSSAARSSSHHRRSQTFRDMHTCLKQLLRCEEYQFIYRLLADSAARGAKPRDLPPSF